jgi:hypothetical protein
MPRPITIVLALTALLTAFQAMAEPDDYEEWLKKVGDHKTLNERRYQALLAGARSGDPEQQEKLALFLRSPDARDVKIEPLDVTRLLYLSALNGQRSAMPRLSKAISKGEGGLARSPAAAQCWSKAPAGLNARLACIELTDFADKRKRPPCSEVTGPGTGAERARLCLANKTPALLEPGPPPGELTVRRIREYAKHGIELHITGDVHEEEFERYRNDFNRTTADALEKKFGPGYLNRLGKEIEAKVNRPGTARPRR